MSIIYPQAPKKGDTVAIVANSSFIPENRVDDCVKAVENLGFKAKVFENVATNCGGFMAGSPELRAKLFNEAFADPEIKCIWSIRGGDGGTQILDKIDWDLVKKNPKPFIGYSDVTCFNVMLNQYCNQVALHGPMVYSNVVDDFDDETRESFFQALNATESYEFKNPKGEEIKVLKEGCASGQLVGGNLCLMAACLKTPYEIDTDGKILFIEEVGGDVGGFEREFMNLKLAGKLENIKALVLGQFTRISNDKAPEYSCVDAIADDIKDMDIPVIYNVQSGHGNPMMTIPLGANCTIDTKNRSMVFNI
ncbi:MAG: LD-carboxypeptidase [Clostridia bacterium]|nr:LD-carboxypeptidase [Clostridia bacterium]